MEYGVHFNTITISLCYFPWPLFYATPGNFSDLNLLELLFKVLSLSEQYIYKRCKLLEIPYLCST